MTWLLILPLTAGGETTDLPAGIMAEKKICVIAGAGAVTILEQANPGLVASWACTPMPLGQAA